MGLESLSIESQDDLGKIRLRLFKRKKKSPVKPKRANNRGNILKRMSFFTQSSPILIAARAVMDAKKKRQQVNQVKPVDKKPAAWVPKSPVPVPVKPSPNEKPNVEVTPEVSNQADISPESADYADTPQPQYEQTQPSEQEMNNDSPGGEYQTRQELQENPGEEQESENLPATTSEQPDETSSTDEGETDGVLSGLGGLAEWVKDNPVKSVLIGLGAAYCMFKPFRQKVNKTIGLGSVRTRRKRKHKRSRTPKTKKQVKVRSIRLY